MEGIDLTVLAKELSDLRAHVEELKEENAALKAKNAEPE